MKSVDEAYAKINLSLDIVSKMNDGYHYLRTIMQTVSLCDVVSVECVESGAAFGGGAAGVSARDGALTQGGSDFGGGVITVDVGLAHIPSDKNNIAYKTALAFYKHTGVGGFDTKIHIDKKIPVCAGLGGGSADAASVLRILDKMHGTKLGNEVLRRLAFDIGADVPYCIEGGTQLAEGRGEMLSSLPPLPDCHIVICKPPFSCSTPELFKAVNCKQLRARPDTDGLISSLEKGSLEGVARRMYNVFEDVLRLSEAGAKKSRAAEVEAIKNTLLDNSALGAAMTGSGSAVFGIFDDAAAAAGAYEVLSRTYKECFLTQGVN